jgi:hypothetical protein
MNVKLLRKIKSAILREPKRIDMHRSIGQEYSQDGPRCGTVGCIAGWTLLLSERKPHEAWHKTRERARADSWWSMATRAIRLLRITSYQGKKLFHVENWPDRTLTEQYNDAAFSCQHKAMAKIVAKRIDQFIRDGQ